MMCAYTASFQYTYYAGRVSKLTHRAGAIRHFIAGLRVTLRTSGRICCDLGIFPTRDRFFLDSIADKPEQVPLGQMWSRMMLRSTLGALARLWRTCC